MKKLIVQESKMGFSLKIVWFLNFFKISNWINFT